MLTSFSIGVPLIVGITVILSMFVLLRFDKAQFEPKSAVLALILSTLGILESFYLLSLSFDFDNIFTD